MSKYRKAKHDVKGRPHLGWVVEAKHRGKWLIAHYCQDEASADKCLERCLLREKEWESMTDDERRSSILR